MGGHRSLHELWHAACIRSRSAPTTRRPLMICTFSPAHRTARRRVVSALAGAFALVAAPWSSGSIAAETIKVGLVTALSGQSALAGEAITRGLTTAIDEINANGGLLGGR